MFQRLILICYVMFITIGFGQEKTNFYHLDKVTVKIKPSRDSLRKALNYESVISQFKMNGYIGIRATDTVFKKNNKHFYFEADYQFKKVHLVEVNQVKNQYYIERDIYGAVNSINDRLIELENTGFPFAQVKIISQEEDENRLILNYEIDSGEFFTIDKIHIKSKSDFHEKTVLSMIGLKVGDPYNEGKIRQLEEIFKNTAVYNTPRAPEVLFRIGKSELYIYIEKKKSSSADGYVGFQQDRVTSKLALNGYINLELKNALNRAEVIHLNWKNNPDKSQNLKSIFEYPYLFGTPFGIGANFDLQKQDSSFVRSDVVFELIYRNPQFRIGLFDQIENSTTISSLPIPGFRDFSKNTIGATFQYRPFMPDNIDFYHPIISLSAGVFNYRADTLDDETQKIANRKYMVKYEHTIDLFKYFHLNNSIQFQGINSSIGLARNEFIYFGGLQTVRGFYELELEGSEIWIIRNELEFKPVEVLSLKLIYDYSNFFNQQHNETHSIGFGFGLINNNSQLDIIVANGILNDNPFSITNTKVHIGFKSNF